MTKSLSVKHSIVAFLMTFLVFLTIPSFAQTRTVIIPLDDGYFIIPIKGIDSPESIDGSQPSANSLTIEWSSSVGATSYRLERFVSGAWVLVYEGAGLSHTVDNLSVGNHLFRVLACDTSCGAPSDDLTFKVVATQTIDYVYDALGRLKQVTDPNHGNRVYNYDKAGNRTSVSAQ